MKTRTIYKCKKCGYEHECSWFMFFFLVIGVALSFVLVIVGGAGVYNGIVGEFTTEGMVFGVGGFVSLFENSYLTFFSNDEIGQKTEELIKNCDDDLCKVTRIKSFLDYFEYDVGKDVLNLERVYSEMSCDCDECSSLGKLMLRYAGVKSQMVGTNTHAWLIVRIDGDKYKWDVVAHTLKKLH